MKFLIPVLAIGLAGCVASAPTQPTRVFDLGYAEPKAKLPPVRVLAVRAPLPFDSVDMHYRLAYRNPGELAAFAYSRWAASPPELVRKQLLRASPAHAGGPCGLELELHEFSQVFASAQASEARLELRAVLVNGASRLAARSLTVVEPDAGTDAAGGAAALARAADRAIAELAGWVSQQKGCAAG